MDSDELRRACERAGAECFGEFCILHPGTKDEWHAAYIHPALPAYVADLLVGMVRELDPGPGLVSGPQKALHLAYCRQFKGLPPGYMVATPEQRIRAAMEVLDPSYKSRRNEQSTEPHLAPPGQSALE